MLNPLIAAFESLPRNTWEASLVLGKSPVETFIRVILPCIMPGLSAGAVLTFVHGMGEFGVTLMIGGSIPGVTRTASIAVYQVVETMQFSHAHMLSASMATLSCIALLFIFAGQRRHAIWMH
jgi:molybdate transport system permease protein